MKNKLNLLKKIKNYSIEISNRKKEIKTIVSTDKLEFDKIVNIYISFGWKLLKNSYSVINNKNSINYSIVLIWTKMSKRCHVKNYKDGNIKRMFYTINESKEGISLEYFKNGQIKVKEQYINNQLHGECNIYLQNGTYRGVKYYEFGKLFSEGYFYI